MRDYFRSHSVAVTIIAIVAALIVMFNVDVRIGAHASQMLHNVLEVAFVPVALMFGVLAIWLCRPLAAKLVGAASVLLVSKSAVILLVMAYDALGGVRPR
jgi:hypothetical protein